MHLDDAFGEKTHDYLLLSSPRKVKASTTGIMLLARVPVSIELWPADIEDYSFNLQVCWERTNHTIASIFISHVVTDLLPSVFLPLAPALFYPYLQLWVQLYLFMYRFL
ncbi:MAG: hypothetical protein SGPRY_013944 [Prymnesium sp.]